MSAAWGRVSSRLVLRPSLLVRSPRPAAALALLVVALIPIVGSHDTTASTFVLILLFGLAAIGLNFTLGVAGEFAIGQIGVFVVGSYIAGVLTAKHGWDVWPAIAMATFASAAIGVLAAGPGLRVGGWPFALTSLLFAIVIPDVVRLTTSETGGEAGLLGIPIPQVFGHQFTIVDFYIMALISTLLVLFVLWRLERSLWGLAFAALRNSHVGAEANGLSTLRLRLTAYFTSSLIAGYAGAVYAFVNGFLSPDSFSFALSVTLIAAVVIGGLGTLVGPIIGMAIMQYIPDVTTNFDKYALLIYGVVLIAGMLLIPGGIVPTAGRAWRRGVGLVLRAPRREAAVIRSQHADHALAETDVAAEGAARAKIPAPRDAQPLVVDHVSKSFGGVAALEDVSLVARPGEITAVIGANGSGKTTLLNIVSGYYRPTGGDVTVGDASLITLPPHRIAKSGVSRTFQTPILMPHHTALQNVVCATFVHRRVPLSYSFVSTPRARKDLVERRQEAHTLLASVGLDHIAATVGDALTPGEQRLVEVACAIARQPTVILLDEPAAGLIGAEVQGLADLLRALRDEGYAVVIIEHNVNLVMSLADHVVALDQGRVIAAGTPVDVQADAAVIESYLGSRRMLLEIEDVRLGYGRVEVVHGVSLAVEQGQFVALLGRNGAGKSTLLNAMAGLHQPTAGTIKFDGADTRGQRADRLVRRGLSAALGRRIFRRQSVMNNLLLGAYSGQRNRAATAESLEMVQALFPVLQRKLKNQAASLSGGEQQMLAIAQALMARPRLLLLDEPSAGLAPRLIGDVFAALKQLREQGLSMLIVEQTVDQTLQLCDHAYVMDRGEIAIQGLAADVRVDPNVQNVYIGKLGQGAGAE